MNFDREPRFYSTLGFDRGKWYGNSYKNMPDDDYLEIEAEMEAEKDKDGKN